ncbi:TetR/AcrR family transcriptional regulator [Niveibacterium sp. SC-1]|uniref:TetR/AcrR family transcriptional regulator n=1 Tax=Niveibacterium sp. SC-1 TaxID=3135646 RepID=UPI00311DFB64
MPSTKTSSRSATAAKKPAATKVKTTAKTVTRGASAAKTTAAKAATATKKPVAAGKPASKSAAAAKPVRTRNGDTRERLLKTAIREFSAKGMSGARIDTIASRAKANVRMVYHYFGSKEALYLEVLEHTLAKLRAEEMQVDVSTVAPLEGVIRLFDFIDSHFTAHPELMSLLSSENLNRAQFLKRSTRIPEMSSPVLAALRTLLARGAAEGSLRAGVDPLHLYVTLVSLAYFHKSNGYTLSRIFQQDLHAPDWQAAHREQAHQMLLAYLQAPTIPATPAARRRALTV